MDTNLRLIVLEHTVHAFLLLFKVLYLYNSFNNIMLISSLENYYYQLFSVIRKCRLVVIPSIIKFVVTLGMFLRSNKDIF